MNSNKICRCLKASMLPDFHPNRHVLTTNYIDMKQPVAQIQDSQEETDTWELLALWRIMFVSG